MAQKYFGIVTRIGHGLITAALASGTTVHLTHVALGDGGGAPVAPTEDMLALVNEVHRAPINTLAQDAQNPALMWAEVVLPSNVGGWYVREAGILDDAGNLVAVAATPESYKPELAEGSGSEFVLKLPLVLTNTDAVTLKIDPTVVLASREHVAAMVAAHDEDGTAHAALRAAIEAAAHGGDEHAARRDNPHVVTRQQIGAAAAEHTHTPEQAGAAPAAHVAATNNPHSVTAAQVGAATAGHTHDERYYTEAEVNARLVFSKAYASSQMSITAGAQVNISHGMGQVPQLIQGSLICVAANNGYSVGDEIIIGPEHAVVSNKGTAIRVTSSQLQIQFGSAGSTFAILRRDGTPYGQFANIDDSQWKYKVRAWA